MFEDRFGRKHDDLRISVTDRCNLRCTYCMPEDPAWFARSEILTYEEIRRLVGIAVGHGVRKIRLTGGEPLVRRDLPRLVGLLSDLPDVHDISLTTNGLLLERAVAGLARAGLRRVNVSLDTLLSHRFHAMTRRDRLSDVLTGIDAATRAGLSPIKVNTVVLRGKNDDEVESLVERARQQGWELRFIEYMPLDNSGHWKTEQVVTGPELLARIAARWPLDADPVRDPHAPATRFVFRDGRGAVGFINSVSRPFCADCSRLRLTSDGYFKVCLYDRDEVDLKSPMRDGASDAQLAELMVGAVDRKGPGGALEVLETGRSVPLSRTMHQIGG